MLSASMNEHAYELIAVDLDGTLLNGSKTVGSRTRRAVNRALEQGIQTVFCTGRSRSQFQQYLAAFPRMRYAIASGGAVVYDVSDWRKLYSRQLEPEMVLEILRMAREVDCMPFLSVEGQAVHPAAVEQEAGAYGLEGYVYEMTHFSLAVEDIYAWYEADPKPVEAVALYVRDRALLNLFRKKLTGMPVHLSFPADPCVEISRRGADKGTALTALCAYLGVPMERTMMIGDSDNDIPALTKAGFAVAMKNAPAKVRVWVQAVTEDCDHDGVGLAIEGWALRKDGAV